MYRHSRRVVENSAFVVDAESAAHVHAPQRGHHAQEGLAGLEHVGEARLDERGRGVDQQDDLAGPSGLGRADDLLDDVGLCSGQFIFGRRGRYIDNLVDTVGRAIEKRTLTIENRRLKKELAVQSKPGPRIIGNTPAVQRLRATIGQIADTDADVLVTGETGTGKELVARALHENSPRRDRNFVAVNCGAVPDNLIETDSPYLAPVPFRGKPNEPRHVVRVAETIAALHDIPVDRLAHQSRDNYYRLFGRPSN